MIPARPAGRPEMLWRRCPDPGVPDPAPYWNTF